MLSAVIFDFDGVLVDTEPLHYRAFQAIVSEQGLSCSWEEYAAVYIGFDDRDAFAECFRRNGRTLEADTLARLIRAKSEVFAGLLDGGNLQPYPGVLELIGQLRGALPLGLCSGALRSDIHPVFERFNLYDAFDVLVTADRVSRSKPHPESYRLAVAELGEKTRRALKPADCLAIEDTPSGIAAAAGAGLRALGVTTTHRAGQLSEAFRVVPSLARVSLADLRQWMEAPAS